MFKSSLGHQTELKSRFMHRHPQDIVFAELFHPLTFKTDMKSEMLVPIVIFGLNQTLRYHFLSSAQGKCYGTERQPHLRTPSFSGG